MRRIVFFFVIIALSYGFEIETPQNTVAVVGQTASLKCRTTNGYKVRRWLFKRSSSEENASVVIFNNYGRNPPTVNCRRRCSVAEDQNGFSVLSFNATMMEDAGNYTCLIERDGDEIYYGAGLIVLLDRKWQCELKTSDKTSSGSFVESNYLEILCHFSFTGNMVPLIKWFRNSHRISLPFHQADNYVDGIHWFHFNTTLQLNASDNGMVFGYEVDFERSNAAGSTQTTANQATNVLSNVFRWNFTAVVLFMPKNIRIEPVKTIYDLGDRVECSADGNPSPNFTWSCDNGAKREGSVLKLDAETFEVDVTYTCQCTAMSSILSRNASETIIIRIIAHGIRIAPETEWTYIIIYVIAGILAAVIAVIGLLIVLRFKGFICSSGCNSPGIVQHHEDLNKTQSSEEYAALKDVRCSPDDSVYTQLEKDASTSGRKPIKDRCYSAEDGEYAEISGI